MAKAERTQITHEVTHEVLDLEPEKLLEIHHYMITARMLDERMWALNRQGKAPFVVSSAGHEGCQVGSAYALMRGSDFFVPYYRDLAVVLVAGLTPRDVLLGVYAKAEDPCNGARQMPSHWGCHRLGIINGSSPIATQIPHAVGLAYSVKYRREPAVVMCWFGEGATSMGDWHEAMNFAGIHKLPVVFVCENNKYAISVPQTKQMAIENVADRAAGYGFEGHVVDGNDVLACYEVAKAAVDKARSGGGPTFIEAKTYRYAPHTSDDDDRTYRSKEEVKHARQHDPIPRFQAYLKQHNIVTEEGLKALIDTVKA
ncbi:MAG TPA: thiamine pyrophosphate-dependent dehydrogenase E1 component subunit alpha, partial [Actinomycetota bacterium]|nr:thiamine pyrophosphate-dependent dehydrogenase E1 component subunit alpha [Actinomycetota bacterium]